MQVSVKDVRLKLGYRTCTLQKLVVLMVDQAFVDYHARLFFRIEMVLFDSRLHIVLQIFIKAELFVFCEPFD